MRAVYLGVVGHHVAVPRVWAVVQPALALVHVHGGAVWLGLKGEAVPAGAWC